MNKSWNDRADKDLFFTILSVKNIGVISGAEWTTIGGHMRTMGYGFTNEGCRQHFQGLRRTQHKLETNGSFSDSQRRVDPTMNPITRRPGPGRGRPRKSIAAPPEEMDPASDDLLAQDGLLHDGLPPQDEPSQMSPTAQVTPRHELQSVPAQATPTALSVTLPSPVPNSVANLMEATKSEPLSDQTRDPDPESNSVSLAAEEGEEDLEDHHLAKRQRLDNDASDQIEDAAVLALAEHGNSSHVDHYGPPEYFDEA
ncbi:Actin cytoskeleton-regulatory complex protein PAN1-like protein 1 [Apiospora arundinis]